MMRFSAPIILLLLSSYTLASTSRRYTRAATCTLGSGLDKPGILSLHNQARERCGGVAKGVNPLVWDDKLACASQAWANRCVWKHSHTPGAGENIACGAGTGYGLEQGVQQWYNEIFQFRDGMGFTEATGHATQMCWKDTTHVGCAVATCSASSMHLGAFGGSAYFLVCQYSPPGNIAGLPGGFSSQVFLPTDKSQISLANARSASSSSSSSTSTAATTGSNSKAANGVTTDATTDATPSSQLKNPNPLANVLSTLTSAGSPLGNILGGSNLAKPKTNVATIPSRSTTNGNTHTKDRLEHEKPASIPT